MTDRISADGSPRLSVVIPALDEEARLPDLLGDLGGLRSAHEVIVCDGGSRDRTAAVAAAGGARVVAAPKGRGTQLRAGAAAARAPLLCFLHADVRLPPEAVRRLDRLAEDPPDRAAAFRLRIDAPRSIYRVLEGGANLRTRALGLPYGDQGLVVRADAYRAAGGHPPIPLMEDVALARALRGSVGFRLLPEAVHVSARRWEATGPIRRTAINLGLLARYLAGTSPDRLAARYRPPGSSDA